MKVRIKFKKLGTMKFIGHLDVMRYFQKLNRRAKVDNKYSEGFSPHQVMSFATPLGLGLTSDSEYVDMELLSCENSKELLQRMNDCGNGEIILTDMVLLPDDAKNAMSLLAAADYRLSFREGYEPADMEAFASKLNEFMNQDEIIITKKTKTSEKEVDLKQLIHWLTFQQGVIRMQVDTGSVSNLKPDLVMESFYQYAGWEYSPFTFCIHREELYGEKDGKLVSLLAYGEPFPN